MSEPALRQLDRGLPRMKNIFTAEFEQRMVARQLEARRKPYPEMVLSLPPPPNVFKSKESKTRMVRARRRLLASKAIEINEQTRHLTVNQLDKARPAKAILLDVAREHGVSVDDIKSPCRAVFLVAVRHQAIVRIYLALHPAMSLPQIGRAMGGRDHTSCLYVVKKLGQWKGQA